MSTGTDQPGYTLYGSPLSYFTKKLEAALDWYELPFVFESRTADNREKLAVRAGTHQIPVLQTPDNWMLADSSPIMQVLDARRPRRPMYAEGPLGVLVHVIEEYFDEWIPRTALHFRWHYEDSAAFASTRLAQEMVPSGDAGDRQSTARAISSWGLRACRATGTEDTAQQKAAEREYERVLAALEQQLAETPFSLGTRPCAVDAVLLGGLRAHFHLDPAPRRLVSRFARVVRWIDQARQWSGNGELAHFPETTAFGRFVLEEIASSYRPVLLANAEALRRQQKAFTVSLYGETASFRARPYPERSREMVRERVQQLEPGYQEVVRKWLEGWDLKDCFG